METWVATGTVSPQAHHHKFWGGLKERRLAHNQEKTVRFRNPEQIKIWGQIIILKLKNVLAVSIS